jgi:DNA-binding MarR family transcriptional regulator/GNAT superfamily N-acetyltransferase
MTTVDPLVPDIRSASRELVRQLGLTGMTIAGTDLSLSGVHAIIEIGKGDGLSAKQLAERLVLEKSTVSRLIAGLIKRGDLREMRDDADGRVKRLLLTEKGEGTLAGIDAFAETQVGKALDHLNGPARANLAHVLAGYASALANSQGRHLVDDAVLQRPAIEVKAGYTPGLGGRMVDLLIRYMNGFIGFGAAFEARVAGDMVDFLKRLDHPGSEIWHADVNGRVEGTITIDGESLKADGLAQLRWFVVSDELRGHGAGQQLLEKAVAFCDARGCRETHLWTVKGLDAARSLYERQGFELAEEFYGDQWGSRVLEQRFVRHRPSSV